MRVIHRLVTKFRLRTYFFHAFVVPSTTYGLVTDCVGSLETKKFTFGVRSLLKKTSSDYDNRVWVERKNVWLRENDGQLVNFERLSYVRKTFSTRTLKV